MNRHYLSSAMLRAAAFAFALTTVACGDRNEVDDTGMAGGAVADAIDVASIDIGKGLQADRTIRDETDDFAPADTVYASVHTTGTAENQSLTVRWLFEDGQVVDERTETISPTGDARTEFHISQPNGLPKGTYTVVVLLNGTEQEREEFEVK